MDITPNIDRPCWFVGASFGRESDQFKRLVEAGIWETGYKEKYAGVINSVQVGDRIAIKSSYTKKNNLPFEGNGNTASVMLIKAIGLVTENPKDGCKLIVDWTVLDKKREWYFYTHRSTLWKVTPSKKTGMPTS